MNTTDNCSNHKKEVAEVECKHCPFKRDQEWRGGWVVSKMMAIISIEEAGNIFACHMKHPKNNVFIGKMTENDCIGFKKMLQNMENENHHPHIANSILETNPTNYNFLGWAVSEGVQSKLFTQKELLKWLRENNALTRHHNEQQNK